MSPELLSFDPNSKGSFGKIDSFDILVMNLQTEPFSLLPHIDHHFGSAYSLGVSGEVLNI